MIDYSAEDLRKIAAISPDQHIYLLTQCGLCGDDARKIIAMPTATLVAGIAAAEGRANKTSKQEAMIAAGKREIIIRQA